jgi:hypothetical protein
MLSIDTSAVQKLFKIFILADISPRRGVKLRDVLGDDSRMFSFDRFNAERISLRVPYSAFTQRAIRDSERAVCTRH